MVLLLASAWRWMAVSCSTDHLPGQFNGPGCAVHTITESTISEMKQTMSATKYPVRVRNELHFREISVKSSEKISAGFQRVIFAGPALDGFVSKGFDDHIKMFFPDDNGTPFSPPQVTRDGIVWQDGYRPPSRDYTPLFDEASNQLAIDFYIHQGGLASAWAVAARPGDSLVIGGPRGSMVIPEDYASQLYICDESGMPALRRRLESLKKINKINNITALITITDHAYKDYLSHLSDFNLEWFIQDDNRRDENIIRNRLRTLTLPKQDYFIWITGEGDDVLMINQYIEQQHAPDPELLRTVAYWHRKEKKKNH